MADNGFQKLVNAFYSALNSPVEWFKESIVEPNQDKEYTWHHRQFRRVPTIDQCYTDDVTCFYEANEQFKRDKLVDDEIIQILRRRMEDCYMTEGHDRKERCKHIVEDYEQGAADWFCKYGDLGAYKNVRTAYMKQKHRMVWERRHGPVGSGVKTDDAA